MFPASSPSPRGSLSWRVPRFGGLFFDDFASDSAFLREEGFLQLTPCSGVQELILRGEFRPHPSARSLEQAPPSLTCRLDGRSVATLRNLAPGPFEIRIPLSSEAAARGPRISLSLGGTGFTNFLAWLGRVSGLSFLQHFRRQTKNRQIRIATLRSDQGETIFDFALRHAACSAAFIRRRVRLEFNIVGFFTADLGVGESARCMARAAQAAGISAALVPLKLHCKNPQTDSTFSSLLQENNPHRVNVIHIDAPASSEIDHHHGRQFRAGKYNVGYWAWELLEFPDPWLPSFAYFDEIWTPSDFARNAIAAKSPLPVLAMPHAISFTRPAGDGRARFGLPADKFLYLFLYDLNSYSARKNPQAVVAAFRRSGLAGRGAALVIKVQNAATNPEDFAALQASVRDLPDTVLITGTLGRSEIYELEAACDCFVSLHRAEGFGLAVAECMYLGKPVISTDWSATAEYLNSDNGCPVRYSLVPIERSYGPYSQGQLWAEADVAHAAEWMQRIFADRALASAIGAAARTTIESRFSPAVVGARYRQRLESIATF
jgi:glycosyltransferase involved in cell wall biosynthesis